MSKSDSLRLDDYLRHIIEAIDRIERYTEDMDDVAFLVYRHHTGFVVAPVDAPTYWNA